MKCSDCIYYNQKNYCERNNDRVYHENRICEYYVRNKMDQEITMNLKLKGNLLVLSDDELYIMFQEIRRAIDEGGNPERMRAYLEIYDKIEKLIRKE